MTRIPSHTIEDAPEAARGGQPVTPGGGRLVTSGGGQPVTSGGRAG